MNGQACEQPRPGCSVLRFAAVAGLLVLVFGLVVSGALPSAASVRDTVDRSGVWGPLIFVLGYAVLAALPTPASALTIAGGALFGFVEGLGLVVAAASIGALMGFGLARGMGRRAIVHLVGSRMETLDRFSRDRGLAAVLGMRVLPVLPFSAVHYACGLSDMRVRDYLLGTVVGIVPGSAAYVSVGAYGLHPGSWQFFAALLGLSVLTVGTALAVRRLSSAGASSDDTGDAEGVSIG